MVYKFEVTVNGEKSSAEGSSHLSAISRAFREYIKAHNTKNDDKMTLEIVSERAEKLGSKEEAVDLKKAQELFDCFEKALKEQGTKVSLELINLQ